MIEVQFPLFTNNKEGSCPLIYNLSSSGIQLTPYSEINHTAFTLVSSKLKLMVPLDKTQAQTYTFYIVATNPKGVQAFSPMITINTQIACRSLLATLSADK